MIVSCQAGHCLNLIHVVGILCSNIAAAPESKKHLDDKALENLDGLGAETNGL